MKRFVLLLAAASLLAAAAPAPCGADEVLDLIRKLNPPRRFGGYTPQFHYTQRTFTFNHVGGPQKRTWRLIMDGKRHVALIRSGDIQLLAFSPQTAGTTLRMPTGRYHLDTTLGASLPTHQFIQRKIRYRLDGRSNVNETDHFQGGGRTITLVRHFEDRQVEVLHKFTLSCHSIFGYMVTGKYHVTFKQEPTKRETTSGAFCPGCYVPWPEQWIYDRTVFCPGGTTEYRGWANNLIAMDRVDGNKKAFTWRDGGFIAYLNRKTGWSPCRTREDGGPDAPMSLCNAHNDFHIKVPFPEKLKTDKAEREVYEATHRLFALPPEATRYIWDHMKLIPVGRSAVMIRIGVLEDFEKQPVPLTEPVRGLVWTSGEPSLTTLHSHSGERSLVIKGRQWPNLPQVSLLPSTKYRLEAWFKVENMSVEQRAAHRKRYDEQAETIRKAGQTPPPYQPPKRYAEAYVTGDFYQWSPHDRRRLLRQRTSVARGDKSDWQQVVLEFTTPKWDPFIDVVFYCEDGTAYMDDFSLKRAP